MNKRQQSIPSEDDVLRRMLASPHRPHVDKTKPLAKKKQAKKRRK